MSKLKSFSAGLKRHRQRWLLALLVIFAFLSFVLAAGDIYNRGADALAKATNNVVVLPKAPVSPFVLGLDLQGGTQLVYQADVSGIPEADRASALEGVRDIIERRVNGAGVSEPVIQANRTINGDYRIIAELAGIKDVNEAIRLIGETPLLEFKEQGTAAQQVEVGQNGEVPAVNLGENWVNTELSGKNLKRATLQFNPNDASPEVALEFDSQGAEMFANITERNIGRPVAIFLDGYPISVPTVNDRIPDGRAVISGRFNITEAKLLVQRLNTGALPVPIELIGQQTVGASLGQQSINNSLKAGLIGFALVALFMILFYRLPGLLSVGSLAIYALTVLTIFKASPILLALLLISLLVLLFVSVFNHLKIFDGIFSAILFLVILVFLVYYANQPVTLTLAGITGFILSIGMAVDANVLIFERMKEELRGGKPLSAALDEGFRRAWPSIRDGNITTILTCFILMAFGTGLIKGFGATLFIGVSVSMFSSIVITHILIKAFKSGWLDRHRWLIGSGTGSKQI
ncbi:MAG: preprotein translocase subunit SecD [Bacillota bacterium]